MEESPKQKESLEESHEEESLEVILQCTRYAVLLHNTFHGCAVSQVKHLASVYHTDDDDGGGGGGGENRRGANMRAALLFYVRERNRDMVAALLDHFFLAHSPLLDPHFLQIVAAAAIQRRDAVSYRRLISTTVESVSPAESIGAEMADVRRRVWAVEEQACLQPLLLFQDDADDDATAQQQREKLVESLIDAADATEYAVRDCGVPSGFRGNMQTLLRNLRPDPAFCQSQLGIDFNSSMSK